ncbi:bactericidal permeability-increasing protein-like [Candoia aspera]|uniref:bactericidal permeability-increasing protein-like n=1 Tax=Candoia aspera TaxID=51853 RepID=UPI002FD7C1AF
MEQLHHREVKIFEIFLNGPKDGLLVFIIYPLQEVLWTCTYSLYLWKMFRIFALLLLSFSMPSSEGATGGLKFQITQKGLEYAKEVVMEMLLSQLKKEQIEDKNSSYKVPPLGDVFFSLSNINISRLQVKDSAVGFAEGTGLKLAIQNAQIVFHSNWVIKSLFGQDSGTAEIRIDQLSLFAVLGLDMDDGGRPLVQCTRCHSNIRDLDIKFSGPKSQLYNLISFALKGILIFDVKKEVCSELKKSVDNLAQHLRSIKFLAQIDSIAGIDYSLVSKPDIAEVRCNLDFKGEFFLVKKPHRSPFLPTPFFLPNQSSSMIVLGISDFLVNSAAFTYFAGKKLQVNYTDKKIPKSVPFRLNTNNIGLLLPELKKQFPGMPMEMHLAAWKEPRLRFRPWGLEATVLGRAEAFVVLPNSSLVSVFMLNIDCNFTGQVFLEGDNSGNSIAKIRGSVVLNSLRLSQEWSRIGEIQVYFLEKLLKIAGQVALSRVNRKLREGMMLPRVYGASFVDPEVTMHEGYMLIKTDLHYPLQKTVA